MPNYREVECRTFDLTFYKRGRGIMTCKVHWDVRIMIGGGVEIEDAVAYLEQWRRTGDPVFRLPHDYWLFGKEAVVVVTCVEKPSVSAICYPYEVTPTGPIVSVERVLDRKPKGT